MVVLLIKIGKSGRKKNWLMGNIKISVSDMSSLRCSLDLFAVACSNCVTVL